MSVLTRRAMQIALIIPMLFTTALVSTQVPFESINSLSDELYQQVVTWRRDFHQNPELSNREFRTAGIVAKHLESLGMEVQTGIAHTGVVGRMRLSLRRFLCPDL